MASRGHKCGHPDQPGNRLSPAASCPYRGSNGPRRSTAWTPTKVRQPVREWLAAFCRATPEAAGRTVQQVEAGCLSVAPLYSLYHEIRCVRATPTVVCDNRPATAPVAVQWFGPGFGPGSRQRILGVNAEEGTSDRDEASVSCGSGSICHL